MTDPATTEREIVAAIRRILRAVELHSRRLQEGYGLTGPQLATMRALESAGPLSPARISERVHLSRATVTGILTRLERRGLVERSPAPGDGRSVRISLAPAGLEVLARAPSLLQERFRAELARLAGWERLQLLSSLERIASMMDASGLEASPHLVHRTEDLVGPDAPTPHPPARR